MGSQWIYPSKTDMNAYSEPVSALTGNRPIKSECAVWDSASVLVKTVPRGTEVISGVSTSSGSSSDLVDSSPRRCWSKCPLAVAAVSEIYADTMEAVRRG